MGDAVTATAITWVDICEIGGFGLFGTLLLSLQRAATQSDGFYRLCRDFPGYQLLTISDKPVSRSAVNCSATSGRLKK
jgi:hypothetical protein